MPIKPNERDIARFFAKVQIEETVHAELGTSCHLWTASTSECGHGLFGYGRKPAPAGSGRTWVMPLIYAHRFALIIAGVDLPRWTPSGKQVSHRCHRANCVNPEHLELKTLAEHQMEHDSATNVAARKKRAKTHCKKGHEFTAENTKITTSGNRLCRTCHRDWQRRRSAAFTPEQRAEKAEYCRQWRAKKKAQAEACARL